MAEQGLAKKIPHSQARGGRPIIQYFISPLHQGLNLTGKTVLDKLETKKIKVDRNRSLLKHLLAAEAPILKHYDSATLVTDTLFSGLFDRVMRISSNDSPPKNQIATVIKIKGVTVRLMAMVVSSSGTLAILKDQRTIRIIITSVLAAIENWAPDSSSKFNPSPKVEEHRRKLSKLIQQQKLTRDLLHAEEQRFNLSPWIHRISAALWTSR